MTRRFVIIAGAILLTQWTITIIKPRGDFLNHREFGRRFLAHEFLYANGMNVPYPPAWANEEWKFLEVSTPLELTMAALLWWYRDVFVR